MIPTLQKFTQALLTPDISFSTLTQARVETTAKGMPRLMRTTHFAEAEISWKDQQWLLSMPLTALAISRNENATSLLRRLNVSWLPQTRVLPAEMLWSDDSGTEHKTDLVLQHLPAGESFEEVLSKKSTKVLLDALDLLEERMRELSLFHKNLKASNLRWCDGQFIPMRCYDATIGSVSSPDFKDQAIEKLRQNILNAPAPTEVHDVERPYTPVSPITGHLAANNVFEGLICVVDKGGYGFVDTDNNPVIPAKFIWAGDFREGRVEVETYTGMGLIDRQGNYIIPPIYEIVDYHSATSTVFVRSKGKWALFDYMGRQLTEYDQMNGPGVYEEPAEV